MMRILIATLAFFLSAAASFAVPYNLFDHPAGGNSSSFDYGLRLDGLSASPASAGYWSFETLAGASLATLMVDISGGVASITGSMRSNDGNALWALSISMTGVVSFEGGAINAGAGSFGATGYTGTLSDGTTAYDLTGKGKDVNGTKYQWTMFFQEPGVSADWRGPNISAGWVCNVNGTAANSAGSNCLGNGANDFLAMVAPVPVPAAGLLLLSAFGGLVAVRRRRQKLA